MIEVHHEPEKAMSDGAQSLYPDQFSDLDGGNSHPAARRLVMQEIRLPSPAGT